MASEVHSRRISAAPPAVPGYRLVANIQRMPLAGRWALGLALALLSGFALVLLSYLHPALTAVAVIVAFGLALAAGLVLSSWWALLALAVVAAAGGMLTSWVLILVSSIGGEGLLMVFGFAVLQLGPLILFLLTGIGLGKQQGIALGPPHALSAGEALVSRWIVALGPLIAAGYLAPTLGYAPGLQLGVVFTLSLILYAIVLAAACLLTSWLLRSWWGLVVAPVIYAGFAAFSTLAFPWFGGGGDWQVWPVGFLLYIVLPAVVMSAIGTAIGMFRTR